MTTPTIPAATSRWPKRYTLVALCACATFVCYIDRVNISVTIIPMAEQFGWDRSTQGLVLSSFFAGYLLTQVFGGFLADRFGGKVVLGFGVLLWSLFTLVTPPAAALGLTVLLIARVGMGLGEAVTFPSVYSLFARWVPREERTRAVGLNGSGIPLGTVFALVVTPYIVLHLGWSWAFYLFGAVGFVWFFAWQRLTTADPEEHPTMGSDELALIRAGTAGGPSGEPPPWRAMLTSLPVWAIIVSHFCANWGGYVLLSWLPTYVAEGLGVDFAAVGLFAMAPHLASFIFLNVAGWCADAILARGWSVTRVRKLMQLIGFGSSALVLAVVGYVESAVAAIALMTLGSALGAFGLGGWGSNHIDIAPRHAGTLMGISNTAGTLPGIIGVYVSGLILEQTGSWVLVFQIAGGLLAFGLVFYLLFASGERQFE